MDLVNLTAKVADLDVKVQDLTATSNHRQAELDTFYLMWAGAHDSRESFAMGPHRATLA